MFLELDQKINYEGSLKVYLLNSFCIKYNIDLDKYNLKKQSVLREVVSRGIDKTTFDYYKFNEYILDEFEFFENYKKFKSNYSNKNIAKKFNNEFTNIIEKEINNTYKKEKYQKLLSFLEEKLLEGMDYYKLYYFDKDMIVEWAKIVYEDINSKNSERKIGDSYSVLEDQDVELQKIYNDNWKNNYEFNLLLENFKNDLETEFEKISKKKEEIKPIQQKKIEYNATSIKKKEKEINHNKIIQYINFITSSIKKDLLLKEYFDIQTFSNYIIEKIEDIENKIDKINANENHRGGTADLNNQKEVFKAMQKTINNFIYKYNNFNISQNNFNEKQKEEIEEEQVIDEIIIEKSKKE